VTWRYTFSGVWAAERAAANATARGGTGILAEAEITYGVGTNVPGPFPDTGNIPGI